MTSSRTSIYRFDFNVSQPRQSQPLNNLSPSHASTAADEVPIEFRTSELQALKIHIGDDGRPVSTPKTRTRMRSRTVWVPKHAALLCDGGARIFSLLSDLGVPAENQEAVSRDISSAATLRSAETLTSPIVVTLFHLTLRLAEFVDDNADESEGFDGSEMDRPVSTWFWGSPWVEAHPGHRILDRRLHCQVAGDGHCLVSYMPITIASWDIFNFSLKFCFFIRLFYYLFQEWET